MGWHVLFIMRRTLRAGVLMRCEPVHTTPYFFGRAITGHPPGDGLRTAHRDHDETRLGQGPGYSPALVRMAARIELTPMADTIKGHPAGTVGKTKRYPQTRTRRLAFARFPSLDIPLKGDGRGRSMALRPWEMIADIPRADARHGDDLAGE
jgi:hypothetical protein